MAGIFRARPLVGAGARQSETVHGVRQVASEVTSYQTQGRRLKAPERAFVETKAWDEKLDGPFDPTKVVEYKGMKGIWRTHGRQGVHIEQACEELGFKEKHHEADSEDPLGAERMHQRRGLLRPTMAAEESDRAAHTVEGPVQDPFALIKALVFCPVARLRPLARQTLTRTRSPTRPTTSSPKAHQGLGSKDSCREARLLA